MRLLEQAFSPTTINTGKGTEFEGAIVALSTPQDHWAHSTCLPSLMNQGRTRDSKNQIAQRLLSFVFFQCVELRNALADYFFRKISGEGASLCANPRRGKPPLTIKKMFHETFPISYIYKVSPSREMRIQGQPACGSEVPYHDLPARQEDGTFWSLLPTNCLDPRVVFKIGMTWTTSNDGKLEVYIFLGSL